MSSYTLTNTAWGEMRVEQHEHAQTIRSICKVCHRETQQSVPLEANAFTVARPEHAAGCRFHPDTPVPPVAERAHQHRHRRMASESTPAPRGITAMEAILGALALVGAFIAGALLL